MSEESTPVIREVEILKKDTVIDVKLPVDFYFRFNQFMTDFFPVRDTAHLEEVLKLIQDGKDNEDPHAYHFRTLLSFLLLVEDQAREQGHTEKIQLNTTTGEKVSKD
jgi:hypothetical protein